MGSEQAFKLRDELLVLSNVKPATLLTLMATRAAVDLDHIGRLLRDREEPSGVDLGTMLWMLIEAGDVRVQEATKRYLVVSSDNFGGDYPNETFVSVPMTQTQAAEHCRKLNTELERQFGSASPRWHKVVEEGYKLEPGFEP